MPSRSSSLMSEASVKRAGGVVSCRFGSVPSRVSPEVPAGLSSLSHFSARWEGTLIAPEEGDYEVGIEGDDGYRLMLRRDGSRIRCFTRNGHDWADRFPGHH